jgi:hypothetical protein
MKRINDIVANAEYLQVGSHIFKIPIFDLCEEKKVNDPASQRCSNGH